MPVQFTDYLPIFLGIVLTLMAYLLGKYCCRLLPRIPAIVFAMFWVVLLLWLCAWPYPDYMLHVQPIFSHLLGYVTVALAIPLAAMRLDDLRLKPLSLLLMFASVLSVALPMGLALILHLSHASILAFATRALTTPVALNIAELLHSPPALVTLIVIVSGIIGAAFSSVLLRHIHDERASGLAMGLAAHAIGTAQAWQRGVVAGRYAALGMAINAILTSLWLPALYLLLAR
jgi:putative effector of murein hydrolase